MINATRLTPVSGQAMAQRPYRLAILTSHPIQYQAPLFRELARHPRLALHVYFLADDYAVEKHSPDFGIPLKWDMPILEGYPYQVLRNYSPLSPGSSSYWRFVNPAVVRELSRKRYDAVIIHGYVGVTVWLSLLTCWLAGTPVFLRGESTLLNDRPWWVRKIKRIALPVLFNRVSAFLCIGTRNVEFYRQHGVPEDRLLLAPYAVDNEYFMQQARVFGERREALRAELGIQKSSTVILYVGKLLKRKRPLDLLMAYERIAKTGWKCCVLFVGEGEQREELEAYARERKVPGVFFLGFRNQGEISRWYTMADVFVLPSEVEPWGVVINEAMCFGLPIVTTRLVGAALDLVRQTENGYIYREGDVDGLTGALLELIDNPKRRDAMGRRSREIIKGWDYAACGRAVLDALDRWGRSGTGLERSCA